MILLVLACLLLAVLPAGAASGDCGTVIIPADADIDSVNPLLADNDADATVTGLMYRGLVWVNRFRRIDWSRSLARAITTPDGGLTFRVTLRRWHWSDGVPVTSGDVAYTLQLMRKAGFGANGTMPGIIKSLIVRDARHFDIVLTHRVNPRWFIDDDLSQLLPLPSHDWSRYTTDQIWRRQSTPGFFRIVDGPLAIRRLDVAQDVVLVPNTAYPGQKPHFRQLIFRFIHSDGSALQMVETGDMDIAPLPMALWRSVQAIHGVHVAFLAPRAIFYNIYIDFKDKTVPFFHDLRVRQAIEAAIDQRAMLDVLFHGYGTATLAPFDPSETRFLAPALRQNGQNGWYDPRHAVALLRQAGYAPGADGIMERHGSKLSFTTLIPDGSDQSMMMAAMLVAELRAVGIEMKLRELDINQVVSRLFGAPDWQAAFVYNNDAAYPTGENTLASNGPYNVGGYSDPKMDRLIEASIDRPGLENLYAYEVYAGAQVPVIFDIAPPDAVLVSDRLKGVDAFYDPLGQLAPSQLTCTREH